MPCGTGRTVHVNGLVLAWAEWGGGPGTPVVLLHSLAAHRHWWDWTAPRWAAGRRVVALDFRGHGASAHAAPPAYTFDDYAGDVVGVLDALGIERARVIGHSMGGFVGALVAARAPARAEALVVADMLTSWTADQAAAERVAAAIPRGTAATLPQSFHHLVLDAPEAFVAAVDGWMAAAVS